MVDLGENRTSTDAGVFTTKPEDASASVQLRAATNWQGGREHPKMSNAQPKKNFGRVDDEACNRGDVDSEGNVEVDSFLAIKSEIETLWSNLEPALIEQLTTCKDGRISKEVTMSAMELCLRSPHSKVGSYS